MRPRYLDQEISTYAEHDTISKQEITSQSHKEILIENIAKNYIMTMTYIME